MNAREQLILDLWADMGKESAGAAEIELIRQALLDRLGAQGRESPASVARILADHGVGLKHPEILEADVRWRERQEFALFTPEELNFTSIEAAVAWIEKLSDLPAEPEVRRLVLQIKGELELLAASLVVMDNQRELAAEVAQWLTIWLQNPSIFADWLSLRRESEEFRARFKP